MNDIVFSKDLKRAVKYVPFGYALYKVKVKDGSFEGRHVGLTGKPEYAEAFLAGKKDFEIITVYGAGGKK